jgi:iron(II)-dependent oxidoreductase
MSTTATPTTRKTDLERQLTETRERTLWMLGQVPDDYLRVRVHDFYSPIGWHFGHVGRTEEYWICQATGAAPCDENLSFLYADLPDNPKDNRVHIPDRLGVIAYLSQTRDFALRELEKADLNSSNPFLADGYAWEFAIQHECQHQETIAEMMQLIQKRRPQNQIEPHPWSSTLPQDFIEVPAGSYEMGDPNPHGYDNEKDPHLVQVQAFRLARHPVTAYQWSHFMGEGGYTRKELWSPEGWAWKESENVVAPEYWSIVDRNRFFFGPFGLRAIHPDEPVSCVSHHEAEAFASWTQRRLLTEAEWEYVAKGPEKRKYAWGNEPATRDRASFALTDWKSTPVTTHASGANPLGIQELSGNVWEWTSSAFLPYPGFKAFPYDGYSKDHMKGKHRVCRGGSWATSANILRTTFRNWYVPTYRQGFLGLRLAE